MVPMQYRPNAEGSLPCAPLTPPPPLPEAHSPWSTAAVLAERFWSQIAASPLISNSFKDIAEKNANVVANYRKAFKAGTIRIPGHNGASGSSYGLPHAAFVAGRDVTISKVEP